MVVLKTGSQVRLYFADPFAGYPAEPANIMSRIDLAHPLRLLAPYTQAMMLALLWTPRPKRALMLGFGGGRLPAVLRATFPGLRMESTEVLPELRGIAASYFGLRFDRRQALHIADARTFVEGLPAAATYDLILVDVFEGKGHASPHSISTREFCELCKCHLSSSGTVTVNLLSSDGRFERKVRTFAEAFAGSFMYEGDGANVLLGSCAPPLDLPRLLAVALQLDTAHPLAFPLARRARWLQPLDPADWPASPLHDTDPPE
ncbi:MAG: spermidine synthase [Chloroflexota bacterium]